MTIRRHACAAAAGLVLAGFLPSAAAQVQTNPVYTDDSPVAMETLSRVAEFVLTGNESEAVRELQRLLDGQPDRLLFHPGRPEVFISVRRRIHDVLLENPVLLERYRQAESPRAREDLRAGRVAAVEQSRLLTPSGLEAALRVAQMHVEAARFDAARLTLEQLERHPDRQPRSQAARDAAALLAQVARYLDRPAVWARVENWSRHAGLDPAAGAQRRPVPAPPLLQTPSISFFQPAPATSHENVPTTPLWSTTLEPQALPLEVFEGISPFELNHEQPDNLWVLPTVVGDTVYINDGTFVSARDRFTLQPRWAVRPAHAIVGQSEDAVDAFAARREAIRGGSGRLVEDTSTVTVYGRLLIATMGYAQGGERHGDPATYAIDAATGRIQWSVLLRTLDPQLDGATVRGPAMIDGDTVILAARKSAPGRRVTSLYLLALSAQDGSLQWLRPIASAGAIPWSRSDSRISQASLLHEGVVYCTDSLGVIAAVEAASGRPLWIRRAQVPATMLHGLQEPDLPWHWGAPIPDGDGIIVLSPDRREVLRLDSESGEVLVRRSAAALGSPTYLLKAGDRLAAVTRNRLYFVRLNDLERDTPRTTNQFGAPGIRGRVVISGNLALVPRSDGVAVIEPASPGQDKAVMRLERLGNVLPVGDQVIVVDADSIHSYLSWDVAHRLLSDRISASPDDPHPAITYAELAYRAKRHEQIASAADRALAAMDRNPGSEPSTAARQRLFNVLRHMVETSQSRWTADEPPKAAPEPAAVEPEPVDRRILPGRGNFGRNQIPAQLRRRQEFPVLDLPVMAQVIDRLGRAARVPDERVSHLMVLGRLREAQGQAAQAAEAYQRILTDPALQGAVWRGPGIAAKAELEASRRIRQLVRERGPSAYAAFEAQAAVEFAAKGPGATAEQLEQLARRYPAAGVSASIWARAAELHESAGRMHAGLAALREALTAAEQAHLSGVPITPGTLGDLAGRLVVRLERLEQYFAAAQLIGRLRAAYPDVAISNRGEAIDAEAFAAELLRRLAALERLPRIGAEIVGDTQPLPGWAIMPARSQDHSRACEHIMLISSGDRRIALWGIPGGAADSTDVRAATARPGVPDPGHLEMLWSRTYRGSPPTLLRLDPESAYLFWDRTSGADGPIIERISTVSGETRWRTDDIRTLLPPDPSLQQRLSQTRNTMDSPIDGPVRLTDIMVTLDEQALVVAERSGRIAAFDPATGRLLWARTTGISRVHDLDAGAGAVVIGGVSGAEGAHGGPGAGPSHLILIHDPRTGEELHRLGDLGGQVRWLRITDGSGDVKPALIAGLQAEIVSFDLVTASVNWTMPGGAAFGSRDAWIHGDRLFILDHYRLLWLAPLATGQVLDSALETHQHLSGRSPIRAERLGPELSLSAFTTDRGVCIFDRSGRLVGIDAIGQFDHATGGVLHPVLAEQFYVAVETTPRTVRTQAVGGGQASVYTLHILEAASAMMRSSRQLQLDLPPRRIALLDGRIIVTAGNNTFIYSAPELDR